MMTFLAPALTLVGVSTGLAVTGAMSSRCSPCRRPAGWPAWQILAVTDPKVTIRTTFETDEYVFAALAAGASGFLTKEIEPDGLRQAVRVVAAGDALLSPSVTRRVVGQFANRPVARGGRRGNRLASWASGTGCSR